MVDIRNIEHIQQNLMKVLASLRKKKKEAPRPVLEDPKEEEKKTIRKLIAT